MKEALSRIGRCPEGQPECGLLVKVGGRLSITDYSRKDVPFGRAGPRKVSPKGVPSDTGAQIAPFPLPVQIVNYLRDLIIHDKLRPGERIREQVVADRLQVSRTPTREALMILAMEGLVNIDPNRGAHVACYDDGALADIRKIQATLEGLACVILARKRKNVDLKVVAQQFSRMRKAVGKQDRSALFHATQQFYYELVASTGKTILLDMYKKISIILYRSRYLKSLEGEITESRLLPHREIMEALEKSEPALARSLILRHRSADA